MGLCLKLVFAIANPTLKRDAFEYSILDEDGNANHKSIFKLPLHRHNEVFSQPSLGKPLGTGFTACCQIPKPPDLKLVALLLIVLCSH